MLPRRRFGFLFLLSIGCFLIIIFYKWQSDDDFHSHEEFFKPDETFEIEEKWKTSSISLKEIIKFLNDEQKIYNAKRFGPVTNETILITIQVHNRIDYLRHLITTLRTAKDIDKVLLIFSHDIYNTSINELVRGIDFCMVMQIFYPYSIQLYPNEFPGTDSRDCERDVGRAVAMRTGCLNARNDDTYGHYREAKFTQMKHHWWWKLNRIFEELRITRYRRNMMLLLLEEDYYVASDFLHTYKLMQANVPKICPQCNLISLGTYKEELTQYSNNVVDLSYWQTSRHNMGMAFNKSTWNEVRKCGAHFCNYDEYNYDFSLQNVNRKCLKNHLFVALIRGPRIFHIGECGTHWTKKNCDVDAKINEINSKLEQAWRDDLLYPNDLEVGTVELNHPSSPLVNNGGWNDRRDHCLCNGVINSGGVEVDLQKCRDLYERKNGAKSFGIRKV